MPLQIREEKLIVNKPVYTPNIELLLATPPDIDFVLCCIEALEETVMDKASFQNRYAQIISATNWFTFIIYYENVKVGLLNLEFKNLLHHQDSIVEIQEFFILKKYRNKGIGRICLEKITKWLIANNVEQIELSTNKKRTASFDFYKNCGFSDSHHKLTYKTRFKA